MKLVVFCEAPADFRTAAGLIDRVLREHGPQWVADMLEHHPEGIREWVGDGQGRTFFDVHRLSDYVKQHDVRVPFGHFDGKPGAADAMMARTIFWLARRMGIAERAAIVIVRDMDDQGDERRTGLGQARDEALRWASFKIVLGCADPMREAWVLAGFGPESDEERTRLADVRKDLGFHPCENAHELGAKDEQAKRSAKRVLRVLTGDDHEREARCWTEAPLDRVRDRGEKSGLRAFLVEVKDQLLPLC